MPPTQEVKCTDDSCYTDMFLVSYTYDVPEEHEVTDLQCPTCQSTEALELIDV